MKRLLRPALLVLNLLAWPATVPAAGSLNPPAAPAPTMRTLTEIYDAVGTPDPNELLPLPDYRLVEGRDFIHVWVTGETTGEFRGSCVAPGLEDSIVVSGWSHSVVSPRDAASGLPTGKRQHKPLTIAKRIDQTTPLFYQALGRNETLTRVTLRFYRTGRTGAREHYYTIELINAAIIEITEGERDQQQISFVYQKIIWTWENGGITAEDDWETPTA